MYPAAVIGAHRMPDCIKPRSIGFNRSASDEVDGRRTTPAKVLFTTGYIRNAIVHHGRLHAGVQMIGKPFPFGELNANVVCLDS